MRQNQCLGPLTAYEHQRSYLIQHSSILSPNPRLSMLNSLQTFIQTLLKADHEVLLMWDANFLHTDPDMVQLLRACSLHNLLDSRNIPEVASTSSRGGLIDFIHGTKFFLSAVRHDGILSFH